MKMAHIAGFAGISALVAGIVIGCTPTAPPAPSGGAASGKSTGTTEKLSGTIVIDGSSTVTPILEAVAEEFKGIQADVSVTVGTSGTGGGMKKFIGGELDMAMASRPIKDEEAATKFPKGFNKIKPYLRLTPQPNK